MKNKALTVAVVLALLLLASNFICNLGQANPSGWTYKGETAPPADAKPPTVTISFPEQKSYASTPINFTFYINSSGLPIYLIYYKTDWQTNNTILYDLTQPPAPEDRYKIVPAIWEFPYSIQLTGVPQGKHNITVVASSQGMTMDEQDPTSYYHYYVTGSATVTFAVGQDLDLSTVTPTQTPQASGQNPLQNVTIILVAVVSVALAGTGLFLYLKKQSRRQLT